MKRRLILAVFIVGLVAAGALAVADDSSARTSAQYDLEWSVLGGAMGEMNSASFRLNSTLGQTMAGEFSGTNYGLRVAGYWQESGAFLRYVYLPIVLRNYP